MLLRLLLLPRLRAFRAVIGQFLSAEHLGTNTRRGSGGGTMHAAGWCQAQGSSSALPGLVRLQHASSRSRRARHVLQAARSHHDHLLADEHVSTSSAAAPQQQQPSDLASVLDRVRGAVRGARPLDQATSSTNVSGPFLQTRHW